jgi:hypothetical protein
MAFSVIRPSKSKPLKFPLELVVMLGNIAPSGSENKQPTKQISTQWDLKIKTYKQALLWNRLPQDLRDCEAVGGFRRRLKTYLLQTVTDSWHFLFYFYFFFNCFSFIFAVLIPFFERS